MNQLGALAQVSRFTQNFSMENIKSEFQSLQSKLATLRTPQEFFNFKKISKPQNFGEVQSRVAYNLKYFSSNYGLIIGCLSIYTLLTNLLLLFVIVLVVAGIVGINKLKGEELVTPFGSFKTNQLYTGLICVAVPIGFLASPISTLLWLIGASAVSVFGHASLMEKPIETVFDEETV
ncbi:CFF_collapsed_G0047730.mRNA.1.CDS.1 [Saccharomyces cerevisiae]|nr:CFF_HP2_G0041160.mRNA.1.CDS.1 [Saccharomyces cerevisiae]CAI6635919.1 CFF_HP2_G0041160.mRNA.1.CDS.1 [Saccharomyces cerevisiae]CAI6644403.1 CFF_HP1_G0043170.mRNA.1.CDS.1 [Saccharomyces cerevisiae]CAI7451846.1 CFF_collapsed_G0047730.mRNA.1.CDS.1 [Saccharomyces cerevisiae]